MGRPETRVLTRGLSSSGLKGTYWGAVGWVLLSGVGGISDFVSLVQHSCSSGERCPAASRELDALKQHQAAGKQGLFHALPSVCAQIHSWSLALQECGEGCSTESPDSVFCRGQFRAVLRKGKGETAPAARAGHCVGLVHLASHCHFTGCPC